jgi:hypothetical protein
METCCGLKPDGFDSWQGQSNTGSEDNLVSYALSPGYSGQGPKLYLLTTSVMIEVNLYSHKCILSIVLN